MSDAWLRRVQHVHTNASSAAVLAAHGCGDAAAGASTQPPDHPSLHDAAWAGDQRPDGKAEQSNERGVASLSLSLTLTLTLSLFLSFSLENVLPSDARGRHGELLHQPQQAVSGRVPAPCAAAKHHQGKARDPRSPGPNLTWLMTSIRQTYWSFLLSRLLLYVYRPTLEVESFLKGQRTKHYLFIYYGAICLPFCHCY